MDPRYWALEVLVVVDGTTEVVVVGRGPTVVVGRAVVGTGTVWRGIEAGGANVDVVVGNGMSSGADDVVVAPNGAGTNDGGGDTVDLRFSSSIDAV